MSTAVPPPAYTAGDVDPAINTIWDIKVLTDEQGVVVEQTMVDFAKTPAARAVLKKEIEQLAGSVLSVQESFVRVGNTLERIIASGTPEKYSKLLNDMRDEWSKIHKDYVTFAVDSRRIAAKARATASDFATSFIERLADESVSVADKKQDIADYMNQLKEQSPEGAYMGEHFHTLGNRVGLFKAKWSDFLKEHPVDKVRESIKKGEEAIATFTKDLETIDSEISKLWTTFGITAAVTGVSGLVGILCPGFWIATFICGLVTAHAAAQLLEAQLKHDRLVLKRQDEITRVKKLAEEAAFLVTMQSELTANDAEFPNIIKKLGAFHSVWARISSDLTTLETQLKLTDGSKGWLFYKRLNTTKVFYDALADALETYAITVDVEKLPKDL